MFEKPGVMNCYSIKIIVFLSKRNITSFLANSFLLLYTQLTFAGSRMELIGLSFDYHDSVVIFFRSITKAKEWTKRVIDDK